MKGGVVALVAFSGGEFHLQNDTWLQDENVTLYKKRYLHKFISAISAFSQLSRRTGNGRGLECYLFVEKMSRGFLNMADESRYSSEEEATYKS